MATSAEKAKFIDDVAGFVVKYAPKYDIMCNSAVIAQAILESGWGESKLAAKYHNYFGLKCGTLWKGKSVNLKTQEEYTPGTKITITDNFRVYDNMEEGIKGYFEFIQLTRYHNLRGIKDPRHYLEVIRADGYATSSSYVTDTMAVVNQYGLAKYDGAKIVEPAGVISKEASKLVMESLDNAKLNPYEKNKNPKPKKNDYIMDAMVNPATILTEKKELSREPKWVGKVTTARLNVRNWAGNQYSNIQSYQYLGYDNLVDVCDTIKDDEGQPWHYIRIAGKFYGFVAAKYITKA